ncbi:hypothetical protein Nepgr_017725 [Nepenthes gracilis]|uniref:Translin n=1 Tax=Nepenthes gracilis TaxID=150966 RepID=A0AAD3XTD8_NEPGR|nr:hypothetical protein Nepgr_017725 [Nepenthes gracilis]
MSKPQARREPNEMMNLTLRNALATLSRFPHSNPNPISKFPLSLLSPCWSSVVASSIFCLSSTSRPDNSGLRFLTRPCCSPPMADGVAHPTPGNAIDMQFETFRTQMEESGCLREKIRSLAMEIESVTRVMHANLLLVHQSRPVPEVLDKAKRQISILKDLFNKLADILRESPGQYYRYHNDWRSETQTVISLLAFMHWLETGSLLMHAEAEEKIGLNSSDFGLDIEDYLVGICFMSNELPRYVVNQVTSGDYDCPRKVLNFLIDLHAAFRMLNLRNDFLRKKFDGMKYDLRRVEEVYYDVKIRGLMTNESPKWGTMEEGDALEPKCNGGTVKTPVASNSRSSERGISTTATASALLPAWPSTGHSSLAISFTKAAKGPDTSSSDNALAMMGIPCWARVSTRTDSIDSLASGPFETPTGRARGSSSVSMPSSKT